MRLRVLWPSVFLLEESWLHLSPCGWGKPTLFYGKESGRSSADAPSVLWIQTTCSHCSVCPLLEYCFKPLSSDTPHVKQQSYHPDLFSWLLWLQKTCQHRLTYTEHLLYTWRVPSSVCLGKVTVNGITGQAGLAGIALARDTQWKAILPSWGDKVAKLPIKSGKSV